MKTVKNFDDYLFEAAMGPDPKMVLSAPLDTMSLQATGIPTKDNDDQIIYLTSKNGKLSYKIKASYKDYSSFDVEMADLKREKVTDVNDKPKPGFYTTEAGNMPTKGKVSLGLTGLVRPTSWTLRNILFALVDDEFQVEKYGKTWMKFAINQKQIEDGIKGLVSNPKKSTINAQSGIVINLAMA